MGISGAQPSGSLALTRAVPSAWMESILVTLILMSTPITESESQAAPWTSAFLEGSQALLMNNPSTEPMD